MHSLLGHRDCLEIAGFRNVSELTDIVMLFLQRLKKCYNSDISFAFVLCSLDNAHCRLLIMPLGLRPAGIIKKSTECIIRDQSTQAQDLLHKQYLPVWKSKKLLCSINYNRILGKLSKFGENLLSLSCCVQLIITEY